MCLEEKIYFNPPIFANNNVKLATALFCVTMSTLLTLQGSVQTHTRWSG